MTVDSPARTTADYYALSDTDITRFDELMDEAESARPHGYETAMARIALLTGLPEGDIRKCACDCMCGCIFDANTPGALVMATGTGYSFGSVQCPGCADDHPADTEPDWDPDLYYRR